jgi:hypothetical protein
LPRDQSKHLDGQPANNVRFRLDREHGKPEAEMVPAKGRASRAILIQNYSRISTMHQLRHVLAGLSLVGTTTACKTPQAASEIKDVGYEDQLVGKYATIFSEFDSADDLQVYFKYCKSTSASFDRSCDIKGQQGGTTPAGHSYEKTMTIPDFQRALVRGGGRPELILCYLRLDSFVLDTPPNGTATGTTTGDGGTSACAQFGEITAADVFAAFRAIGVDLAPAVDGNTGAFEFPRLLRQAFDAPEVAKFRLRYGVETTPTKHGENYFYGSTHGVELVVRNGVLTQISFLTGYRGPLPYGIRLGVTTIDQVVQAVGKEPDSRSDIGAIFDLGSNCGLVVCGFAMYVREEGQPGISLVQIY